MPKGVYERKPRNSKNNAAERLADMQVISKETDEQIDARIAERFEILDILTEACMVGNSRSLIVSGPPGLGKSFTVEKTLAEFDPNGVNHIIIKGYVRATGLIKMLYRFRETGQTIVFDDADTIFFDDTSLNLLKAVCDTTENRRVSWLSEGKLVDEETGEAIPTTFDFEGTVIFISNLDFDAMIEKGHRIAPHLSALISRSHYIDTGLKTRRDYLIRIRQVIRNGMLSNLSDNEREDVLRFIEENSDRLRELSLRMAIKIGNLRKSNSKWEKLARVTCCKL
jgi:hypothetical protein